MLSSMPMAKNRFVVDKYDSLVVLNDIHVQLRKGDVIFAYDLPEYRKTLKTLLNECPTLTTDNTAYTETGLINLLKEYLTFCRIDSKIYSEQKKSNKVRIGVGVFGSSWRTAQDGPVRVYGLSGQFLMPKQFYNSFALIDLGASSATNALPVSQIQIGVYAGRYFGTKDIQAKLYTGLSTVLGALDTGVGVSYRKMIAAEVRYPVLFGLLNGFREDGESYLHPLFNLRAVILLSKRERN